MPTRWGAFLSVSVHLGESGAGGAAEEDLEQVVGEVAAVVVQQLCAWRIVPLERTNEQTNKNKKNNEE